MSMIDNKILPVIKEHAKRMRIMVVDVDQKYLTDYEKFLSQFFQEVITIQSPSKAINVWKSNKDKYDIVLLSLDEENVGNLELFKQIRKKSYEQKIIIALISNDYNDLQGIICAGIDGVIRGPKDTMGLSPYLSTQPLTLIT